MRKHILDAFLPIIHTKTLENTDENGGFRKRFQKWRRLKAHRFENDPFLVWAGENGDKYKNTCVDENILFRFRRDENGYF